MKLHAPPMGFNTWNTFGRDISDELIRKTDDRMEKLTIFSYFNEIPLLHAKRPA